MIYAATQAIYDAFMEADLKCTIRETDDSSLIRAGVNGSNCDYEILFISRDNDNDVSIRIFSIAKIPAAKADSLEIYKAINECNDKYRYFRFAISDDNTITISYDVPVRADNIGGIAVEMCIRVMHVIDDCYPILMRAIYA